jgi:hypothetical protein
VQNRFLYSLRLKALTTGFVFQTLRSRDEISIRKFTFGVFTQPRPNCDIGGALRQWF